MSDENHVVQVFRLRSCTSEQLKGLYMSVDNMLTLRCGCTYERGRLREEP